MLDSKDADALLARFRTDSGFRDRLLTDPKGTAASLGISLSEQDAQSIKADAEEIRAAVTKGTQGGVLAPTLVKIIKWTPGAGG